MTNIRFVLAILSHGCLAVSLTTCGGGSSSSAVLNSISVPVVIPVGANQQFTAVGVYSDGTSHDITTQVTWASSNLSVVTVTGSGRATALAAGTVNITAASGSVVGSTLLTTTPLTLSSMAVTPANPSVPAGFGQQFVAIGRYSDGTSHDITTQVTWASSNPSVVTVTGSGRATALRVGTVNITATSGSISGGTTLTVTSAILSSISVTPANPSIPVGTSQQFSAIGTFSDGTSLDITTQVSWSWSNTSVATINNNSGLAIAVAVGTVTITATSGSISGSTTLTVTSASLSSIINVIPATFVGTVQQFMALGAFSDGSTQNISNEVVWTSSSPSVATISSTGVVTALSAGSTSIVATKQFPAQPGNIQGGTSLDVLP